MNIANAAQRAESGRIRREYTRPARCEGHCAPRRDGNQQKNRILSYHIRNVPAFSTIEMSPGCGFTIPRKKPVFSCAASLVATDDCWPEPVWVWGMGARGKGQRPFLCPSREKRTRARERPDVVRDSGSRSVQLGSPAPARGCGSAPTVDSAVPVAAAGFYSAPPSLH